MSMSLRQLAHAIALARHRNFKRAAAELHISQPALTRSIKALEAALGTTLFDRLSSGLELTPGGEVFLQGARRVLKETGELEQALADFSGLASGALVISTGPYPGDRLVPDAMAAIMVRFPGIQCQVREVDWSEVASHLLERESNIAVADLTAVADDDRFETELLISDRMYFLCRREHPLAGPGLVSFADLSAYPLVGNRVPGRIAAYFSKEATAVGAANGLNPFRVKIDLATFAATRRVVLATDGITMAPLINAEEELENGSMTVLRTGGSEPRMYSGLIFLKDRTLSPAATQFAVQVRRIKAAMDLRTAALAARFDPV
jgi:DNA-binding transcriptional LysR family regulator